MKVLNLETGQIEDRVDTFEGQREQLEQKHSFIVDGVRFAGYCIECRRPVLWGDHVADINKICGNIRVTITHKHCL